METTTFEMKEIKNKFNGKVYPKATYKGGFLINAIETIDHPFLQGLIGLQATVGILQGEYTVLACDSLVLLFVYETHVEIECIATVEEERGKGSATKVMNAMCQVADETGTVLKLRTANVTGNGWAMAQHTVVANGRRKKGKIPVGSLPAWYEKFGFVKVEKVLRRGRSTGWRMERFPKVS